MITVKMASVSDSIRHKAGMKNAAGHFDTTEKPGAMKLTADQNTNSAQADQLVAFEGQVAKCKRQMVGGQTNESTDAQTLPNPEREHEQCNNDNANYGKMVTAAEEMLVTADVIVSGTLNDDIAQTSKNVSTVASKLSVPSEQVVSNLAGISPNVTEAAASDEAAHHNANRSQHLLSEQQLLIHNNVTKPATNHSDLPVHNQNAQDGRMNDFERKQHRSNMQNQGSVGVESGKMKSNWKSAELTEHQLSKQMVDKVVMPAQTIGINRDALDKDHTEVSLQQREKTPVSGINDESNKNGQQQATLALSENQNIEAAFQLTTKFPKDDIEQYTTLHNISDQPVCLKQSKQIAEENTALISSSNSSGMVAGGKIQVVKSYPPIPYTYIENKDHEDFSIFNGENKQLVLANTGELVIKSKLWEQRQFDDEESWEEGSTGFSSAEEDQEDDYDSSREELDSQGKAAIVLWNTKTPSAANSNSLLTHNAAAYIPKFNTTTGDSRIATTKNDQKETAQKVIQFLGESSNAGNKTV